MPRFGRIYYDSTTVPKRYRCTSCGAHGCKLWREYSTFANHITLECGACALRSQKKEGPLDENGRRRCDIIPRQMTDQIGWRVPAVPTEEGDTFWGYSSVPERGVAWWRRLPTTLAPVP